MRKLAVVFDLDGTLASKKHAANTTPTTWNEREWICGAKRTEPLPYLLSVWNLAGEKGVERIVLTARPEGLRDMTYDWLRNNVGFGKETDMLLMSPNVAYKEERKLRSQQSIHDMQAKYKVSKLKYLQKSYRIAMYYDDNETIIEAVAQIGDIPTCLVKTAL